MSIESEKFIENGNLEETLPTWQENLDQLESMFINEKIGSPAILALSDLLDINEYNLEIRDLREKIDRQNSEKRSYTFVYNSKSEESKLRIAEHMIAGLQLKNSERSITIPGYYKYYHEFSDRAEELEDQIYESENIVESVKVIENDIYTYLCEKLETILFESGNEREDKLNY